LPERLAVFRAGFRGTLAFVSDLLDDFSGDVSELIPADGCSLPSAAGACGSAACRSLAPPWRVIFGMWSSSKLVLACTPSAAADPCSA
jgi:hypothetical protein